MLAPTASTGLPDWLYRGYTGHEHLDQFGLINMNGRLYDPVLGRMLSPDNYVQEPGMTQSFNRYTYAMNNPLVYTDPDGNFWNFVIGAAIGGFSGYKIGKAAGASGWGLLMSTLGGAAIGAFTAGLGSAVTSTFGVSATSVMTGTNIALYAASGAITGAVSGASFAALAGGGAKDIGAKALMSGGAGAIAGVLGGFLSHTGEVPANNILASAGGPGDSAIAYALSLTDVVVKAPFWQRMGVALSETAGLIASLPFVLEGDVSNTRTRRPRNTTLLSLH